MTNPTRKYFARILTDEGVNQCIHLLEEAAGRILPPEDMDVSPETITVRAPDGDAVFIAMRKDAMWICRLHREVFDPATSLDEAGTHIRTEGKIGGFQ